jgi:hypothetical protein
LDQIDAPGIVVEIKIHLHKLIRKESLSKLNFYGRNFTSTELT